MPSSSQKILTAILVAGLSTAATMAVAEQVVPPPAEHHGGWGERGHHMMPTQMVEARIAYIKTALQITPAQTPQFNAVADFMRKQAKEREAKFTEMKAKMEAMKEDKQRPDFLAMLDHRQKMLSEASANLSEFAAVVKPLYATLSDSQKEIAGEVLHHGHGGMGGGFGHGPHGGPEPF